MDNLENIISNTNQSPTITNNDSNFVVITYWWGRGNLNNNTARPCVSYYEDFFKNIIKICTNTISSINKLTPDKLTSFTDNLEKIADLRQFTQMLKKQTKDYLTNIYSYAGITENSSDKYQIALQFLEKLKLSEKTPKNYEFKNSEYVFIILYFISKEFIKLNKQNIIDLYENNKNMEILKGSFLNKDSADNITNIDFKHKLDELNKKKTSINDLIKKSLNFKNKYEVQTNVSKYLQKIYEDSSIQNKSLNELLIQELRYLNPQKFEDMIENWQNQCAKHNCNYMAVEYPEFAKPGGYQLAINAKPLFIKKCLDLCGGKSVLYIDGDMNIRKYPIIFDLKDVDYMARGWWIDPRASYFEESISYDPYNFETSGGTMFFSSSEESRLLLDMWIIESNKSYQKGKADDRIISMIFNTKKMLLNMKIIQLPIEYLWLTLDYNDRLLESELYDYNNTFMESTIIIDHPECLTSEDTASGSGSSNDRTPKFYNFLDYNLDPVSENYYEFLAFPDIKYRESLKDYLKYMSDAFYIDDGNQILYEKGFVEQGRSTIENEQPLYIFPFENKYGNKNSLSESIIQRAENMDYSNLFVFDEKTNIAEIKNPDMALIYKILKEGKDILYKPDTINNDIYTNFILNIDSKYKNIEFAFVPIFNGKSYNDIFRPLIDTKNCIYISHKSLFMRNFITMFESLDDLSIFINNGFYQMLSSVRISYLINKKKKINNTNNIKIGGNTQVHDYENEYLNSMEYIDNIKHNKTGGGHKKTKHNKKHNKKYNKKTRKNKKNKK